MAETVTRHSPGRLLLGGIAGLVGAPLALGLVVAATFIAPWFRWDTHALSELGVGEAALAFNGALYLGGIAAVLFAVGLWGYVTPSLVNRVGTGLFGAGAISLVFVGVFTIEAGLLHGLFALGFFVLGPIGLLFLAVGSRDAAFRWAALGTGVASLVAILVLPLVLDASVGFAVPEILEAIVLLGWVAGVSVALVRAARWAQARPGPETSPEA